VEDSILNDEYFMRIALNEAKKAADLDEVPIGAVIVAGGVVIARAHNLVETLNDVTAHAEMMAFTAASEYLGGKFLRDCTLYVTLEPCPMCAGAAYWTRVSRVVFGAYDAKRGYSTLSDGFMHPSTVVKAGVMQDECAGLMTEYFRKKRL
jgi:tRNA(adenine34) deaminase